MLKFINAIIAIFLLLGLFLFVYAQYRKPRTGTQDYTGMIAKYVPEKVDGWTSKERPLGNTPEVERAVHNALQASDYFSRDYTSNDGKLAFGVYVAYWERGKDGTANAGGHTPDVCWVANGWKNHLEKSVSDYSFDDISGLKIYPANYRYMTYPQNGTHANVLFWFVQDGKLFNFKSKNTYLRNPVEYVKSMFLVSFMEMPELYFVRVESTSSFDELKKDAGFVKVIEGLGKLVLSEKPVETKSTVEKSAAELKNTEGK